jgi:long-chain acyl-CoA synthetase
MLTHRNLIANTFHWLGVVQPQPNDVYLVVAPLFHAAGSNSVLASVWTGGSQVVVPQFDPVLALDLIVDEKVTDTLGVPTMLAAMTEEQLVNPRDVSTLRTYSHGGSPIATETVRRAHMAFPQAELIHLYGATETGPLVTALRHEENYLDQKLALSCGQPIAGVQTSTIDDDGATVPVGTIGEIAVRGPNVMQGYWNKEAQTNEVLVDGWYRTGDLGYVDENNYVFLVDRKKDMIVSGGENVYCTEVEDVLYKHADVLEAAVFGIPDEQWGEAVHAVVVPRNPVSPDDLIAHCRESLGGYKVPKSIALQDDPLPKSGPGKILKRELRAPYWEGSERNIN